MPVYLLGAEMREAVPVIPLAEDHALSVGIFTYRDRITFGCYADPEALPEVSQLPAALNGALLELARASARETPKLRRGIRPAGRFDRGAETAPPLAAAR